jgi:hypothetical protein
VPAEIRERQGSDPAQDARYTRELLGEMVAGPAPASRAVARSLAQLRPTMPGFQATLLLLEELRERWTDAPADVTPSGVALYGAGVGDGALRAMGSELWTRLFGKPIPDVRRVE